MTLDQLKIQLIALKRTIVNDLDTSYPTIQTFDNYLTDMLSDLQHYIDKSSEIDYPEAYTVWNKTQTGVK